MLKGSCVPEGRRSLKPFWEGNRNPNREVWESPVSGGGGCQCPHCCHRTHKNSSITYFHAAVTPVLVAPGRPQVISLEPEFITPQDGQDKQDCENAAAKRWIAAHPRGEQDPPVTLLGDDLYCNQLICETVLEHRYHFIFVCKRTSHRELYDWVDYLERVGEVQTLTWFEIRGRKRLSYHYRFVNKIPLGATQLAMDVNWCEVTVRKTRI